MTGPLRVDTGSRPLRLALRGCKADEWIGAERSSAPGDLIAVGGNCGGTAQRIGAIFGSTNTQPTTPSTLTRPIRTNAAQYVPEASISIPVSAGATIPATFPHMLVKPTNRAAARGPARSCGIAK